MSDPLNENLKELTRLYDESNRLMARLDSIERKGSPDPISLAIIRNQLDANDQQIDNIIPIIRVLNFQLHERLLKKRSNNN